MMFKQQLSVRQVTLLSVLLLLAQIVSSASSRQVKLDGQDDDDVWPLEVPLDEKDESSSDHTSQSEEYLDGLTSSWKNQKDFPHGWSAGISDSEDAEMSSLMMEESGFKPKLVECGRHKPRDGRKRIAGGYQAKESEFPSYVQVMAYVRNKCPNVCGGTIISETKVLTAAHCFNDTKGPIIFIEVIAGSTVLNSGKVALTLKHCEGSKLAKVQSRYDISIVTMSDPFQWSESIQPACLPNADINQEQQAHVVGFGSMTPETRLAEKLQVLPVKRNNNCSAHPNPNMVCLQPNEANFDGATCYGDSGGPVYMTINGKQTVVAVTSGARNKCEKGSKQPMLFMSAFQSRNLISQLADGCKN